MLLTNTLGVKLAFSALLISTSAITCDSVSPPSCSEHQIILTFKNPFLHIFGPVCHHHHHISLMELGHFLTRGLVCYWYKFDIYNLLL